MSKKLSAQEYAEMRSEDPSQLIENAGMDISPSSPWKTPIKNDAGTADKIDDDAADALENLSLSEQNKMLQDKNKELEEQVAMLSAPAPSVASVSSGKYKNPERHAKVLVDTKHIIDGINALEGDKCALWWCKYNIEKLLVGDKPACYDSYQFHAKSTLKKEVAPVAGSS
jgi:hypothetical protein